MQSWQRSAMAGAALQSFCSWMVTFTDAAIEDFAHVAVGLAAAGCPWFQPETQRVLQDEMQLPEAQTMHTPQPSQTYRVQFGPEVLDPLCHGLGHAIFRIALAQEPSMQSTGLPVSATDSTGSTSRPSLGLVAEAVAGLHVRTTYALATEGVLLTQSLLAQLKQVYASQARVPGTIIV